VPFHVEIRRSHRRAWAFNLNEERLRAAVVEPWRQGRPLELGDREWKPQESTLRVLEGPELRPQDLAFGQGWHNAERSAEEATARILSRAASEASAVAILAQTADGQRTVADAVGQLGVRTVDWVALRSRLVAAQAPAGQRAPDGMEIVAVVLVVERPEPTASWLFEAGVALGALGGRAIVAQLGDGRPPPQLRDFDVVQLDPGQPELPHALAERLRQVSGAFR